MAVGRMSHDWDLFADLICYTVNVHLTKANAKYALHPDKIHPYREKKAKATKPFSRSDWMKFKAAFKRQ